ncbi:glycoside hydrolase family 13 protein [Culicoidibacter larvae]|uniref:Alpha-glucosidase n=1 Tax=Culicoidibacter larvae TaxID=2579976 RepID=A0A5R8QGJ6_9FIRM|nr:alpha-glucosidase [Culicoidibacter larvae]TLG77135.1 alpha-glucosidase [Culicoidibacter larvae]
MEKKWWQSAVVYQVYPRSFYDSDDDGVGDIRGVIEKLDYIDALGANVIWLNPIFHSPNDDNGYDISDFYGISPIFGTMDDVEELIQKAHLRGIKIIFDLVMNHTSDEHPWFIESRSAQSNFYRDFYIWQDGGPNGEPPTNWEGFFGGSVWEYDEVSKQYYMHLFSKKMPDLNWTNPDVREAIYDIARFWSNKGIDGFRVDAIIHIAKDMTFPQAENLTERPYVLADEYYANLPKVHDYVQEFNREVIAPSNHLMTVGEGSTATVSEGIKYSDPARKEFDMIITFAHLSLDYDYSVTYVPPKWATKPMDLNAFKAKMMEWQHGLFGNGWNTLYWNNHDMPRVVSRFGDVGEYWKESAKMLATLMYLQWGTPYILQGEELGMTNTNYSDISDYRDVEVFTLYDQAVVRGGRSHDEIMTMIHDRCRDNARTPMQWDAAEHGGFSHVEPWIKTNENYKTINVEAEMNDPDSILNHYRKVLQLRHDYELFIYGTVELVLEDDERVYAYIREYEEERVLVICNFYGTEREIPFTWDVKEVMLSNYDLKTASAGTYLLRPYESIVYKL